MTAACGPDARRLPQANKTSARRCPPRRARVLAGALGVLAAALPAVATELPWLPPRGSGTLALELGEAAADTFYTTGEAAELTFGGIETETERLTITYALGDAWAVDASFGNDSAFADQLGQSAGRGETGAGIIWRPVNEQFSPAAPSVALRVGWIGAGDYPANRVIAPGPGAGGYAASIAVGKVFREALSLSASLGSRMYEEPVPGVISARVSAALLSQPATLERLLGGLEGGIIFRATYRRDFLADGLDIDDPYLPDLDPERFDELAREFSRGALGIAVAAGAMEIAAETYRYMGGRNVGAFSGMSVRLTLKADLLTLLGLL